MAFKIQGGLVIPQQGQAERAGRPGNGFEKTFLETLKQKKEPVRLSAHARERLDARQIVLDDRDLMKLNEAVDTLEKKGARESLILYRDAAFIASIRNRTIITAMKDEELDAVTNIDSAIRIR